MNVEEKETNDWHEQVEKTLLEAEQQARNDSTRLDHPTVFSNFRRRIDDKER